ncbi:hypothetical protein HK097_003128 [Rhizophlyctis rosea]|uniref:Uncharacterized protein n=1 Tax=Rhizophlyctis rosea TaxID=64517 RepID=A0AAD5SI18_9FUNG|nr:hypothetical protein HK097_003128 [Rhizophlyctis rosea]
MSAKQSCLNAWRRHAISSRPCSQPSSLYLQSSKRQFAAPTDSNGANGSSPKSTPSTKPSSPSPTLNLFDIPAPIKKSADNSDILQMFKNILDKDTSIKRSSSLNLPSNSATPPSPQSPFSSQSAKLPPVADLFIAEREKPFVVNVNAGRNNTMCNITNPEGNVLTWSSAGVAGLKKAARGTSDAGYQAVYALTERAMKVNVKKLSKMHAGTDIVQGVQRGVHLRLKGFGPGRDQAFRALMAAGWNISRITDLTGIRHGGCRPRKARRL